VAGTRGRGPAEGLVLGIFGRFPANPAGPTYTKGNRPGRKWQSPFTDPAEGGSGKVAGGGELGPVGSGPRGLASSSNFVISTITPWDRSMAGAEGWSSATTDRWTNAWISAGPSRNEVVEGVERNDVDRGRALDVHRVQPPERAFGVVELRVLQHDPIGRDHRECRRSNSRCRRSETRSRRRRRAPGVRAAARGAGRARCHRSAEGGARSSAAASNSPMHSERLVQRNPDALVGTHLGRSRRYARAASAHRWDR
jgi:hypothetical protein